MTKIVLVVLSLVLCVLAQEYTLKQVQLLTRHGARSPYDPIPNHEATWICNLNPLSIDNVGASLAEPFSGRLYRKQYMNGRQTLPGTCSLGQLTSQGAEQHYKLGVQFRQRYVDELKLLNPIYNHEEIYLRSVDVPRCIQSAQHQLLGLYPPSTIPSKFVEVVDINVIEVAKDDLEQSGKCPELVKLCNEVQTSKEWITHISTYDPLYNFLQKEWNATDDEMPDWTGLYGNFLAREFHGLPLPPHVDSNVVAQTTDLASWQLTFLWNDTRRTSLAIGMWISELVAQMQRAVKGERNPKYLLYSAHDTTLAMALSALKIFDGIWPHYASHLQFELYQSNKGEWAVGILYNDKQLFVEGCEHDWYCPLDKFLAVANKVIPTNWAQECRVGQYEEPVLKSRYSGFSC